MTLVNSMTVVFYSGFIIGFGVVLYLSIIFIFPGDILNLKLGAMTVGELLRILGGVLAAVIGGSIVGIIGTTIFAIFSESKTR